MMVRTRSRPVSASRTRSGTAWSRAASARNATVAQKYTVDSISMGYRRSPRTAIRVARGRVAARFSTAVASP